jgi:hypothetical protein
MNQAKGRERHDRPQEVPGNGEGGSKAEMLNMST